MLYYVVVIANISPYSTQEAQNKQEINDEKISSSNMALEGFDVDAYAAKYAGRNRTDRLLFIAQICAPLRRDAHLALVKDLKDSLNMKLYLDVVDAATKDASAAAGSDSGASPETSAPLDPLLVVDQTFVENVKRNAAQQHERLEQELNSYKSTMIKESIRVCVPAPLSVWVCVCLTSRLMCCCAQLDGTQRLGRVLLPAWGPAACAQELCAGA